MKSPLDVIGGKLTELAIARRDTLDKLLREGLVIRSDVSEALNVTHQHASRLLWKFEEIGVLVVDHYERISPSGPQTAFFRYRESPDEKSAPRPVAKSRKQLSDERRARVYKNPKLLARKNLARRKRARVRKVEDPEWVMKRKAAESARYARTKTVEQIDPLLAIFMRGKSCAELEPRLDVCPKCGGTADNGFSRQIPPSPYFCTKCMDEL